MPTGPSRWAARLTLGPARTVTVMSDLVKVANYLTKTEAETAAVLLKNAGIPCLIQSAEGMLHGPLGLGATIYVAAAALEEAQEVPGITDSESESETIEL